MSKSETATKRKGIKKMKKCIEYIIVDKWGAVHHAFNTIEEAKRALSWFPADMEVFVEKRERWGC
jgi:hypothetical protein